MSSKCLEIPWKIKRLYNAAICCYRLFSSQVYTRRILSFFFRIILLLYPTCVFKRVTLTWDNIWRSVCGCLVFDSSYLVLIPISFGSLFFALLFFYFIFLATSITFVLVFRSTARIQSPINDHFSLSFTCLSTITLYIASRSSLRPYARHSSAALEKKKERKTTPVVLKEKKKRSDDYEGHYVMVRMSKENALCCWIFSVTDSEH